MKTIGFDGVGSLIDRAFRFFSAEWLLDDRANGGTVILIRTLIITLEIMAIAAFLDHLTDSKTEFSLYLDLPYLRSFMHQNLTWFGAVAGFVYLSLYARFSSQWTYIANLYNQIVSASALNGKEDVINRWWAGFIEDCWMTHLARKPMFAHCIDELLKLDDSNPRHAEGGKVINLLLISSLGDDEFTRLRNAVADSRQRQKRHLVSRREKPSVTLETSLPSKD